MSIDGTYKYGSSTPKTFDDSCIVQQHDGKLLILGKNGITVTSLFKAFDFQDKSCNLGGYHTHQKVYRYDPVTKTFEDLPDFQIGRSLNTGCALFYSPKHNNRPVAYLGGGRGTGTAELLDYTQTDQWERRK